MTQENSGDISASNPSKASGPNAADGLKPPQLPPKRKSRWVRRIVVGILALVAVLLIVVGLAPTLLSTGAGRSLAVGLINDNLNGHVVIADWSLGWTSGIRVDGMKVFDDANRQILQLPHFSTKLSLVGATRGQIHLGKTVVEGLDFFAERFPDGSLNFDKLAKTSRSKSQTDKQEKSERKKEHEKSTEPSKLPAVDGELQLTDCRGTFQTDSTDAQTRQPRQQVLQFTSIAGSVKIPSINDPIVDSLEIAVDSGGGVSGTISADGHFQLAKNNRLVDFSRLGAFDVEQKVAITGIDLAAAMGMISPAPNAAIAAKNAPTPIKIEKGALSASLAIGRDKEGRLVITPSIDASNVILSSGGVPDPIGAVTLHGAIFVPAATGAAGSASLVDQVGAITFDHLAVSAAESSVTLNGSVADLMRSRKMQNLTVDLAYNAARLWKAILPLLSPEQQAKLKDAQVAGNYTKRITLGGDYPDDADYHKAIAHVTAGGEIQLDLFDGEGIALKNFIFPFALAGGKLSVAYADKPAGQNLPPPAALNDGTLNLAGVMVNLSDPHTSVTMPPGTKLLENVSLNKQLASMIGDYVNNPLMIDADSAAGLLTLIINVCDAVPTDDSLLEQSSANVGVLDLTMTVSRIQLGNPTISKIADAISFGGKKVAVKSLQGNLNPLNVHMARGITTEKMVINLSEHNRSLGLDGSVVMKTRMIDMTLNLPFATFGVKSLPGVGDAIKLPLTGPANKPGFDVKEAIKKNFNVDPDDLLKGIFNKGDKSKNGADGDQPRNDNPLGDILGKLKKKKKSDADQ
ncbi:MAG TPA: hypothetical protein VG326_20120 [Tepidisphaeraceae bacterium]|jgi:hypothetical protein|nr:hypothetical protein [Tepidisphaeraceae bacterium]